MSLCYSYKAQWELQSMPFENETIKDPDVRSLTEVPDLLFSKVLSSSVSLWLTLIYSLFSCCIWSPNTVFRLLNQIPKTICESRDRKFRCLWGLVGNVKEQSGSRIVECTGLWTGEGMLSSLMWLLLCKTVRGCQSFGADFCVRCLIFYFSLSQNLLFF